MKNSLMTHGCWAAALIISVSFGWRGGAYSLASSNHSAPSTQLQHSSGQPSDQETRAPRNRVQPGSSALEGLFGTIVSPAAGIQSLSQQAFRDPNPIARRIAFSRLLEALTPENAAAIRAQMVSLGADDSQWRDFHYSWGAIAGKAAFDHAAQSEEMDLAATMSGWAAANPNEALAVLNNLPPEMQGQKNEITASVIAGIAHKDPAMATELVLRLGREGDPRAEDHMNLVAGETLRTQGPEQASQWVKTLPDGDLKGTAMEKVAQSYADKDLPAAVKWVADLADQDYVSPAIEVITENWVAEAPLAAVEWLEGLPAGEGQKAGLQTAFSDWEDTDPAAAGEYLVRMSKSPKRDAAVSGFASGYAWQNPQLSISWAQSIQDPRLREQSLQNVARAYYYRNPEAAREWLPTSGLSAEAQRQAQTRRRY